MTMPRFMIAAPASGSGKTLITCGILQALVNRGMKVASFKCGPDYIDPMFHSRVIGTRSKNLDAFFTDDDTLRFLFARTADEVDISVIEGVMGYYDGSSASGSDSSSCDVAMKLKAPTVLLINCKGASVSVLATLKGFLLFRENNIRGVIFNNMSENTFKAVAPEAERMGVRVIGYVPRVDNLVLESRHLGLVLPSEVDQLREKLNELAAVLEDTLDFGKLIELASEAPDISYSAPNVETLDRTVRIGLAMDEAFCFTYEDNIELLKRCGAEIIEFSPVHDEKLPEVDGIVLSGGYPELHAEELAGNTGIMEDIRRKVSDGMPCMAECGGFMYLHENMEGQDGRMYKMCGVIPGTVRNTGKLSRFGYVTLTPRRNGMIGSDVVLKGHEFHYWDSDNTGGDWRAEKTNGTKYGCMHDTGTLVAGFPHLYYYSNPEVAHRFLQAAERYSDRKGTE